MFYVLGNKKHKAQLRKQARETQRYCMKQIPAVEVHKVKEPYIRGGGGGGAHNRYFTVFREINYILSLELEALLNIPKCC